MCEVPEMPFLKKKGNLTVSGGVGDSWFRLLWTTWLGTESLLLMLDALVCPSSKGWGELMTNGRERRKNDK